MTHPNRSTEASKPWEWSILKASIENNVMGAFSDGYSARQGDGQTVKDAQEKCQHLTLRIYEALRQATEAAQARVKALELDNACIRGGNEFKREQIKALEAANGRMREALDKIAYTEFLGGRPPSIITALQMVAQEALQKEKE